jgi:hypothetical protein
MATDGLRNTRFYKLEIDWIDIIATIMIIESQHPGQARQREAGAHK